MFATQRIITTLLFFIPLLAGCNQVDKNIMTNEQSITTEAGNDTATFGMGCFWCTEAVFQQLKGVVSVTSGYTGGNVKNPAYREVCTGLTDHAEVSQIVYDTNIISFSELLEVFWTAHDPTTLNRQGADQGTQYRSAVFYHNESQKQLAETFKKKLNEEKAYPNPVVTEISPLTIFYKAEDYHMDYYNSNGSAPYCKFVIEPKVEKIRKVFKEKTR
ncbi:MAG: peptide-methionine (S)-S-oxide reductase MsrA [Bacteroidales bacterium]|nr:peptide-methionine (S)-S-oxide reductase MsrA [Bacteroidales bacterium]